eukprot:m.431172 g.431172  ORF g.431172 m.431172 type:complete len:90 (-) comp17268_c0_seq1:1504-1773(-)
MQPLYQNTQYDQFPHPATMRLNRLNFDLITIIGSSQRYPTPMLLTQRQRFKMREDTTPWCGFFHVLHVELAQTNDTFLKESKLHFEQHE